MSYNYDPELAAMLEFLPEGALDLTDPVATRAAFLEMIADPEYQEGHGDREGGLARTALLAMTPGEGFAALDEGKGIR